jgi:hypothetical protein
MDPTPRGPHGGVWRASRESGIPITVTRPDDPAYSLLLDDYTTTPTVHRTGCYICEDPEFAQMGLPLCKPCPRCRGHIAADDTVCDDCHLDLEDWYCGFAADIAACAETNC